MLRNQRRKLNQIDQWTLIVGVDIGKGFNALVLMDYQGNILEKLPRVYNSYKGYQWMIQRISLIRQKNGYRKIFVGLEPTGHYWRKFAFRMKAKGAQVVFVKTTSVKYQRGLYQSNRAKSDVKDAYIIANLIREGKYCDTEIVEDVYQALRRIVKCREGTCKSISKAQNRLIAWLDDYFPELRSCFSQTKAKSLRELLKVYPTPKEVKQASCQDLTEILSKASRRKVKAEEKAEQIKEEADRSIGLKNIRDSDRLRLNITLSDIEHFEKQKKMLENEITRLLSTIEYGGYLLSVKGIGLITAAIFLGELGDPKNFQSAKQIVSYSGLDPFETESGKVYGRRHISKEGRFLLRATLYRMAISTINHHPHFKSYYQSKLERKEGIPLKKKEVLCAVAIKVIKLLFALMRDRRGYQDLAPERRLKKVA